MKNILTFIIIISILGCQSPNKKLEQKNRSLIKKNKSLAQRCKHVSSELGQEKEKLKHISRVLDFSTKIIISDTLPKFLYENFVYEEPTIDSTNTDYQFLYALGSLVNTNRNSSKKYKVKDNINDVIKYPGISYYLYYLWKKLDRSPKNIKNIFNENKELVYSLLKNGNSYKSSGFKNTVKILLLSYEEMHDKKTLLNDLYKRTDSIGVLSDTIYRSIESNKMSEMISKFRDEEYVTYSKWAYSFWVRRNKENNLDTVYQIIKEFDEEMNKYKFIENKNEEEYYEDEEF
jgi:hypothetical protein